EYHDVLFIYPVHMSPIVRNAAFKVLSNHERILLLDPIDFPDMVNLIARSYLILSDSGGLQEECTVFHKPMVLMRDTTERPEAVNAGSVYLAGTDVEPIYSITKKLLTDIDFYNKMANAKNPFGDGKTSKRIVDIVANYFGFLGTLPDEYE
ncbi:UDP-N-acetylglucosamine 2-epimerase, partial [Paenibacillus riograndensis]